MSKIHQAVSQIEQLNTLNTRDQWVNRLHPLVKLGLTIIYIITVVSFEKDAIAPLIVMVIYPMFVFSFGDLSFKDAIYRLRIILPVVMLVGVFNPFFDREIVLTVGGIGISSGVLSMVTLMIKGVLTVLAGYLLIATTRIEEICYALRLVHIPTKLVAVILLIYRYIFMFIKEVEKVSTAYHLRAPNQKGIHFKAWGPLVGQILLRSMDKAQLIYEAMALRGFKGEYYCTQKARRGLALIWDILYFAVWVFLWVLIRNTGVLEVLGEYLCF